MRRLHDRTGNKGNKSRKKAPLCKGSCRQRRLRDCKREEKPEGIKQERKRQSLRLATRKGESRRENMTAQATKPSVRRRSSAAQRTRFSGLSLAEIRSPKEFQRLPLHRGGKGCGRLHDRAGNQVLCPSSVSPHRAADTRRQSGGGQSARLTAGAAS